VVEGNARHRFNDDLLSENDRLIGPVTSMGHNDQNCLAALCRSSNSLRTLFARESDCPLFICQNNGWIAANERSRRSVAVHQPAGGLWA
jgi:hypothetical protein